MTLPKHTPFTRLPKWIRWPILLWLSFGLLPLLSNAFGFQILPSPEWAVQARVPAIISGVSMAGFMAWAVALGIKIRPQKMGKAARYAVILFAPIMGFPIGSFAVLTGGPMIAAITIGTETEIQYTIAKVTARSSRRCRNRIDLMDMLLFSDQLCGFSPEFKSTLARGDAIIVTGHGTAWGLFPHSAHRVE